MPGGDVFHDVFVAEHVISGFENRAILHVDFALTRRGDFVMLRFDLDAGVH